MPMEEAIASYMAKSIDPKGVTNWGHFVIYPSRHWVVLTNKGQILGYLVSELLFNIWGIPHLIGLRQNPSSPNEVKTSLRYLLSSAFCAFCVQLHHSPSYPETLARNSESGAGLQRGMENPHGRWQRQWEPYSFRADVAGVLVAVSYVC